MRSSPPSMTTRYRDRDRNKSTEYEDIKRPGIPDREWSAQRREFDRQRLERSKNQDGLWKREWDADRNIDKNPRSKIGDGDDPQSIFITFNNDVSKSGEAVHRRTRGKGHLEESEGIFGREYRQSRLQHSKTNDVDRSTTNVLDGNERHSPMFKSTPRIRRNKESQLRSLGKKNNSLTSRQSDPEDEIGDKLANDGVESFDDGFTTLNQAVNKVPGGCSKHVADATPNGPKKLTDLDTKLTPPNKLVSKLQSPNRRWERRSAVVSPTRPVGRGRGQKSQSPVNGNIANINNPFDSVLEREVKKLVQGDPCNAITGAFEDVEEGCSADAGSTSNYPRNIGSTSNSLCDVPSGLGDVPSGYRISEQPPSVYVNDQRPSFHYNSQQPRCELFDKNRSFEGDLEKLNLSANLCYKNSPETVHAKDRLPVDDLYGRGHSNVEFKGVGELPPDVFYDVNDKVQQQHFVPRVNGLSMSPPSRGNQSSNTPITTDSLHNTPPNTGRYSQDVSIEKNSCPLFQQRFFEGVYPDIEYLVSQDDHILYENGGRSTSKAHNTFSERKRVAHSIQQQMVGQQHLQPRYMPVPPVQPAHPNQHLVVDRSNPVSALQGNVGQSPFPQQFPQQTRPRPANANCEPRRESRPTVDDIRQLNGPSVQSSGPTGIMQRDAVAHSDAQPVANELRLQQEYASQQNRQLTIAGQADTQREYIGRPSGQPGIVNNNAVMQPDVLGRTGAQPDVMMPPIYPQYEMRGMMPDVHPEYMQQQQQYLDNRPFYRMPYNAPSYSEMDPAAASQYMPTQVVYVMVADEGKADKRQCHGLPEPDNAVPSGEYYNEIGGIPENRQILNASEPARITAIPYIVPGDDDGVNYVSSVDPPSMPYYHHEPLYHNNYNYYPEHPDSQSHPYAPPGEKQEHSINALNVKPVSELRQPTPPWQGTALSNNNPSLKLWQNQSAPVQASPVQPRKNVSTGMSSAAVKEKPKINGMDCVASISDLARDMQKLSSQYKVIRGPPKPAVTLTAPTDPMPREPLTITLPPVTSQNWADISDSPRTPELAEPFRMPRLVGTSYSKT